MRRPDSAADAARKASATFDALHPKLFGIAYRMLQVRADAEDAVQEAWIRLGRTKAVDSAEGFLTTTVTRICIDHLRSARVRRERYVGPWLPEPLPTMPRLAGRPERPDDRAERAEAISIALLRVIDRLDPVERAVFLLREAFAYPYAEIARIVDRKEDHCRQIARRAAERVRAERPASEADPETHARLLTGFLTAAAEGDLAGLEAILADDVVLYSDSDGKRPSARRPVFGPDRVARFIVGIRAKATYTDVDLTELNGYLSAVVRDGDTVASTISLDVVDRRIRRVFIMRNPDKLRGLPRPPSRSWP